MKMVLLPPETGRLQVRPITLRAAQSFVTELHRHNKAPRGHKLSVGLHAHGALVGIGVLSRPVARALDTGLNAEITRTCTDGSRNANSKIYGALLKIAKAMGYHKVYTYTQDSESGSSLRAVGFVVDATLKPRKNWHASSKQLAHIRDPECDAKPVARKRWVVVFAGNAP